MVPLSSQFVMSTELECLTVLEGRTASQAIERFFEIMRGLAPTLPGPSGIFNAYGRVYIDCGHLEMALCECASPYLLPQMVERQQGLIARAVAQLREEGFEFMLANNNHSGLLRADCPIWGAHENHMTELHPSEFGHWILPFLVSRFYAGAGGIEHPSGRFLAGVRPVRMELATGGGTTGARAIHSTAREEHHMGPLRNRFRYHLILGDGHRSHFNLALQFAATALALKAVVFDVQLRDQLRELAEFPPPEGWVSLLQRLNVLALPGQPPVVDALSLRTQRLYFQAASRYAARLAEKNELPAWVPRGLQDWEQTLTAAERHDRQWLASHLDAFAKFEFVSAVLQQDGIAWENLTDDPETFHQLALMDHSYHAFCDRESVFERLDRAGLLDHRVADPAKGGDEPEPFVPETQTRATPRARFIRDHAGRHGMVVDWACVHDSANDRFRRITDPLAREFEPWSSRPARPSPRRRVAEPPDDPLQDAERAYDRGEFELARQELDRLRAGTRMHGSANRRRYARLHLWIETHRGQVLTDESIESHGMGQHGDLAAIVDVCFALRFSGLCPSLRIQPWIDRGFEHLAAHDHQPAAAAFREHAALVYLKSGRAEEARELLTTARDPARFQQTPARLRSRILATLGETYRVLRDRRRARRLLSMADNLQREHGLRGDQTSMTWPSLSKWQRRRAPAKRMLGQAADAQQRAGDRVGLARSLLLQARLETDRTAIARNRERLLELRDRVPALARCALMNRVLIDWAQWVGGENSAGEIDRFWGV